jgi:hypothetical protein
MFPSVPEIEYFELQCYRKYDKWSTQIHFTGESLDLIDTERWANELRVKLVDAYAIPGAKRWNEFTSAERYLDYYDLMMDGIHWKGATPRLKVYTLYLCSQEIQSLQKRQK